MNISDVRKLVNDKGELHFTSAQAPDVRQAITKYVKRYQSRFDAGKITSKQIRNVIGFNTNQIFIDGNKAAVDKVTQVLKGNVANVGFGKSKFVRELQLDLQTPKSGIVTQTKAGSDFRKKSGALLAGQEDHHIRFRTLFDPFYRHLPEKDQIKLTNFLLSEGFAIGNTVENLVGIDKDLHADMNNPEAIHKWAIDNNIQVTKGDPGFTNWVRDKKGKLKAIRGGAKGTSGSALNARMLNLDHITNVNEMQVLLGEYVNLVNEPLENYTAKIINKQDIRRYGEGSPQVRSIESIKQNFANERGRIAAEFELLHGDDARYFDAKGNRKFSAFDLESPSPHLLQNMSQEVVEKFKAIQKLPLPQRRQAVKALAISGGLTVYGGFGTAMSAAETYGRKSIYEETGDPLDKLQYQIAGGSLAADSASYIPTPQTVVGGSASSFLLDAVNTGIDTWRHKPSELELKKAYQKLETTSAIKEGERLTTDKTLSSRNIQGTNVVKDEETDAYYPYTIPRI